MKLDEESWFLDLGEASPVMDYGMPARCWVRWNSQQSKNCVSLSPRVENLKVKKVIKGFVPELPRVVSVSSVFRDSYAYEHFTCFIYAHILQIRIFHVFIHGYTTKVLLIEIIWRLQVQSLQQVPLIRNTYYNLTLGPGPGWQNWNSLHVWFKE